MDVSRKDIPKMSIKNMKMKDVPKKNKLAEIIDQIDEEEEGQIVKPDALKE